MYRNRRAETYNSYRQALMSAIENKVCEKIQQRAEFGLVKYGVSLERTNLTRLQWLVHAQEEAMDLANYLEVLIQEEQTKNLSIFDKLLIKFITFGEVHGK
jgi:hypothetical protein